MVFQKAVLKAEPDEDLKQRVSNLTDSITSSVFHYTTRGLFECDKLTFTAQLAFQVGGKANCIVCMVWLSVKSFRVLPPCLDPSKCKGDVVCADRTFQCLFYLLSVQILLMDKKINPTELDFLVRYPIQPDVTSPVDFLSNLSWGGIKVRRG